MVKEEDYLLTNQEILGGLKSAVERGQSLKDAMMSFYQSGYKKEEIEDAARAYLYLQKGVSEVEVLKSREGVQKGEQAPKSAPAKVEPQKAAVSETVQKKPEAPKQNFPDQSIKKPEEKKFFGIFGKKEDNENKKAVITPEKTKVPEELTPIKEEPKKAPVQKISGYGEEKKEVKPVNVKSKAQTVTLTITLLVLVFILAMVFLFKAELVNFINSLFG